MKKVTATLLLLCMICCYGILPLYAQVPSEKTKTYETLRENTVTYVCRYDADTKTISVKGNINHDILVTHNNYTIEVYRIAPGSTFAAVLAQEDATPLANTAIAIKFEFSVSAEKTSERFSRYAIVLRSPEGARILAAEPQYAETVSAFSYDAGNRETWKGIAATESASYSTLGFGTAIVPVYLNRLLSATPSGYMYPLEGSYCYFDKTYIDELDAAVRSYSAFGTAVYLQFLLPDGDSSLASVAGDNSLIRYWMPNVYAEDTMAYLCVFSEFLAERYRDYQSGMICGIVLGRSIDRFSMNYAGDLSLESYAEQIAFYLTIVGNSARAVQPNLDMVLPFSHVNSYSGSVPIEEGYTPSLLLEAVLRILDNGCSSGFSCSTMVESDVLPIASVSADETEEESAERFRALIEKNALNAETMSAYTAYLSGLKKNYASTPVHCIYRWNVSPDLSGNALACAYVYTYYKLYENEKISSFVVSLGEEEKTAVRSAEDLKKILRYIDTADGFSVTEPLLPYFGIENWQEIFDHAQADLFASRKVYCAQTTGKDDTAWTGTFSYFDFSGGDTGDWVRGSRCTEPKTGYDSDGIRVMHAEMTTSDADGYAELLCLYTYAENFVYTPIVQFTVLLDDEAKTQTNTLYEVVITIGNGRNTVTAEYIVRSGEVTQLFLDMSEYNTEQLAQYIQIRTRVLAGDGGSYAFSLQNVTGYSTEYTSEQLRSLVEEERQRIRNQSEPSDEEAGGGEAVWIIAGILLAVTAIGIGVLTMFRKEEEKKTAPQEERNEE